MVNSRRKYPSRSLERGASYAMIRSVMEGMKTRVDLEEVYRASDRDPYRFKS